MSEETIQKQVPKRSWFRRFMRKFLPIFLVLLVILLALTSVYFYRKSKSNPAVAAQAEVASLVEKVGKLIVLPSDETPTVATVSDPQALKGQEFFAEAKKGDKVLIFTNAKKAILYDPVVNKIITIAPLNISSKSESNNTQTEKAKEDQTTPPAKP